MPYRTSLEERWGRISMPNVEEQPVKPSGSNPCLTADSFSGTGFITSLRVAADGAAPFAPQAPLT